MQIAGDSCVFFFFFWTQQINHVFYSHFDFENIKKNCRGRKRGNRREVCLVCKKSSPHYCHQRFKNVQEASTHTRIHATETSRNKEGEFDICTSEGPTIKIDENAPPTAFSR